MTMIQMLSRLATPANETLVVMVDKPSSACTVPMISDAAASTIATHATALRGKFRRFRSFLQVQRFRRKTLLTSGSRAFFAQDVSHYFA